MKKRELFGRMFVGMLMFVLTSGVLHAVNVRTAPYLPGGTEAKSIKFADGTVQVSSPPAAGAEVDPVFISSAPQTYLRKVDKAADSDLLDGKNYDAFVSTYGAQTISLGKEGVTSLFILDGTGGQEEGNIFIMKDIDGVFRTILTEKGDMTVAKLVVADDSGITMPEVGNAYWTIMGLSFGVPLKVNFAVDTGITIDGRDISVDGTLLDAVNVSTAGNRTDIDTNTAGIVTLGESTGTNKTAIDLNTSGVADLRVSTGTNKAAIDTNTGNITTNATAIAKQIMDKDGVNQTTDFISRGKTFCALDSTTTVTVSWASAFESINITPIGNYAGSIFLYEVFTDSFSIVNSALDSGTSVYWQVVALD